MMETEEQDDFMRQMDNVKNDDVIQARQNTRAPADNAFVARGLFVSYAVSIAGEKGRFQSVELNRVPAQTNKTKRDGKSTFVAPLQIMFRVNHVTEKPGVCELVKEPNGSMYWRCMADVLYIKEKEKDTEAFLRENYAKAWTRVGREQHMINPVTGETTISPNFVDANSPFLYDDAMSKSIREFISADGISVSSRWYNIEVGKQIKVKVRDGKPEKCIFRKMHPVQTGSPLVVPYTPMSLIGISPTVYVSLADRDVEMTEADSPEAAAAGGGEANTTATKTRKEMFIRASPVFECSGDAVIDEGQEVDLCESERFHMLNDPNAHNLVPVQDWWSNKAAPPPNQAYFYVSHGYSTPWLRGNINPKARGISIKRFDFQPGDLLLSRDDVEKPRFMAGFSVFQWFGSLPQDIWNLEQAQQYSIKVCQTKDDDKTWRSFGITDAMCYADIIMHHKDIPLHMFLEHWVSSTRKSASNAPDIIRKGDGMANMCGYYTYGIKTLVPDFLRYFRRFGLRLSEERVKTEFDNWIIAGKRRSMDMRPVDAAVENPINSQGTMGAVVALGNGQLLHPGTKDEQLMGIGKYHAYNGNAVGVLDGKRDFYVLINYTPKDPEACSRYKALCGSATEYADKLLDELLATSSPTSPIRYWIYAVQKDAKQSTRVMYDTSDLPPRKPAAASTAPPAAAADAQKRPREDVKHSEEEDEESDLKRQELE